MIEWNSSSLQRSDGSADLVLVGGGGHCRSVIEAAESAGITIAGIIDLPSMAGSRILGYPVLGTDPDIPLMAQAYRFTVTLGHIGDPAGRERLCRLIEICGGPLATVIARTAVVSPRAVIGDGTVILHRAFVNAGAIVGANCIINTGAIIEHDARVGDNVHVSTGAILNGGVSVGRNSFIGSGATVIQGISIGENITVGAGAVVVCDLAEPGIYYGVPARLHKKENENG